jgi:hypothetical protein
MCDWRSRPLALPSATRIPLVRGMPVPLARTLSALLLHFAVSPTAFGRAAGGEWEVLNREVLEPCRAGEYDHAVEVAKMALGPDHPSVASSLHDLAALYRRTERNAEAERLERRAARAGAVDR